MQRLFENLRQRVPDLRIVLFTGLYCLFLIGFGVTSYVAGQEKVETYVRNFIASQKTAERLPGLSIDIGSSGSHQGSIKMDFSLEVASKDLYQLEGYKPIIMDRVRTVLSDTPPEQLKNRVDLHFVRENMLMAINRVSGPVRISNVFIEKLLVQD